MRFFLAAVIIVAYIVFTVAVLRAHRRKAARAQAIADAASGQNAPMLIAYASQTGYAEQIAKQTAQALQAANIPSRVRSLAELSVEELSGTERALFVVSTYGEGDPPDTGLPFVHSVMSHSPALSRLAYGVLALGDRTYRNFCGFGKTLDSWLRRQCAVPMFDLVEVDNADEAALLHWQRRIGALGGSTNALGRNAHVLGRNAHVLGANAHVLGANAHVLGANAHALGANAHALGANAHALDGNTDSLAAGASVWTGPRNERWQIAGRRLLNPGSAGHPCFHIELKPVDGAKMRWSAGDIAVLTPPGTNAREYSIASMPSEGSLHILVRQSRRADGTLGVASGWLTEQAPIGSEIPLRIRVNSNFHSPEDARPIILIGNGTGIAGLRSHLKAREGVSGARNWLIFGERNAAHDSFYRHDIERWRAWGVLTRVDLAFSRDQDERIYVQHVIQRSEKEIREWVANGATIFVCGSAAGMAAAVDEALAGALGRETLNRLLAERRYRRDVY